MFFTGTALEALDPQHRTEALKKGRLITLKRGTSLADGIDPRAYWALVVKGVLRVESYAHGSTGFGGFLTKGDLITEGPAIMGDYPFGMRAVVECDIFLLPRTEMHIALANCPGFALSVVTDQANRIMRLYRNISRSNAAPTEQAVGRVLFELSTPSEQGHVVDRRITQKDIADALGMSREQVNKVIKMLESRGLVDKGPEGYVVGPSFAVSQVMPVDAVEADLLLQAEAERWRKSREREQSEIERTRQESDSGFGSGLDLDLSLT